MEKYRFGWIEACLRYAGHFGAAEKEGYRQLFEISEATVSRDQDRFWPMFEQANSGSVFKKNSEGSPAGRRLTLLDNVRLAPGPLFPSMPMPEVWLRTIFSSRKFVQAPVMRASPDEGVLRNIVQGIEDRASLSIAYYDFAKDSVLEISPHALVWGAGRLHLRAFDHSKNEYDNFVLSRIVRATLLTQERRGYADAIKDEDWCRLVKLTVQAKPETSAGFSKGVLLEFGLDEDGRKTIKLPKALTSYLLDDVREEFSSPVKVSAVD